MTTLHCPSCACLLNGSVCENQDCGEFGRPIGTKPAPAKPTPRTHEAIISDWGPCAIHFIEFAKTLERDLADADAAILALNQLNEMAEERGGEKAEREAMARLVAADGGRGYCLRKDTWCHRGGTPGLPEWSVSVVPMRTEDCAIFKGATADEAVDAALAGMAADAVAEARIRVTGYIDELVPGKSSGPSAVAAK